MKGSGKPDDRKGHVRFEAAGAGDGFTVKLVRHRQTKETETDKLHLRDTAPVLDPTSLGLVRQDVGPEEGSFYLHQPRTIQNRKPALSARSKPPTARSTSRV